MSLGLNRLLDNDYVTPLQQRTIRGLIHYEIELYGDNHNVIYFQTDKNKTKFDYDLDFRDIPAAKLKIYKIVMFHLIKQASKDIGDVLLKDKIKKLLGSNGDKGRKIKFRDESFTVGNEQMVRAQSLYKAVMLCKRLL